MPDWLLSLIAEPIAKAVVGAVVALITGYVAMVLAKWRKEAQIQRTAARDSALGDIKHAQTEDEFADAQKRITDSRPK